MHIVAYTEAVRYNGYMFLLLTFFLTLLLVVYSYFLIDPNITLFQHPWWVSFRDFTVYMGYYQRETSWYIYLSIIFSLFTAHIWALKKYKNFPIWRYVFLIGGLLVLSHPFLSHDFFNYMFDARILTEYGKNPYLFKALDFPTDQWTRFMHWTHRTYPYGPSFLPVTLVPSILGMGKFSVTLILFKLVWIFAYCLTVFILNKLNKRYAVFFATHPYILIEGLVNGHNDFIGVALAIVGVWYVFKLERISAFVAFIFSIGIKYVTAPVILINFMKTKMQIRLVFILQILLLVVLIAKLGVQQWYFLSLFVFVPYVPRFLEVMAVFFAGLLFSYYPYIRFGGWDTSEKVDMKNQIIIAALMVQCVVLFAYYFFKRKAHRRFLRR